MTIQTVKKVLALTLVCSGLAVSTAFADSRPTQIDGPKEIEFDGVKYNQAQMVAAVRKQFAKHAGVRGALTYIRDNDSKAQCSIGYAYDLKEDGTITQYSACNHGGNAEGEWSSMLKISGQMNGYCKDSKTHTGCALSVLVSTIEFSIAD